MNVLLREDRAIRWVHPFAWWTWSLCAGTAASLTSNPLALLVIAIAALSVVVTRGAHAPWAASVSTLAKLAAIVILFRVIFQTLLGAPTGLHVAFRLPEASLPGVLSGLRLGGVITWESLLLGTVEGMRFAAILLCIGAATTVAAPSRLFRALPDALATVGTVLIIAMTFVPHLVQDFTRIRRAQRLRGRSTRGIGALASAVTPVVDGAMERSLQLAAAMNGRGYGRTRATRHRPDPWRTVETVTIAAGFTGVAVTIIVGGSNTQLQLAPLAWPALSPLYAFGLLALALPAFITPYTPRTD